MLDQVRMKIILRRYNVLGEMTKCPIFPTFQRTCVIKTLMKAPAELSTKLEESLKSPTAVMVFERTPALMDINLSQSP
jgi:hypothetical protein